MAKTIAELIARTRQIEESIPKLDGAFADFKLIRSKLLASQGRKATVVVGTIKAGKTTLVNALVGYDLLPRGSGVKSLILTTISSDLNNDFEIQLRSPQAIANTMRHDFRILGSDVAFPVSSCNELITCTENEYLRLIETMRADGRFNLETGLDSNQTIIHTAFIRIKKTLAGLKKLTHEFDRDVLNCFQDHRPLAKGVAEMDYFERFSNSADLAAITELIKLRIPFKGRLDQSVQIIDCQGSDSLNPLDISSVRSAFYSAERILYVINSRLGLRQGDRDLLRTIRNSKLSCPVLLAINIEHFEPRSVSDIVEAGQAIKGDFEKQLSREEIPTFAVNALVELHRSIETTNPTDILGNWQVPNRQALNSYLDQSFSELIYSLKPATEADFDDEASILPTFIAHATESAIALLSRDGEFGIAISKTQQFEIARMLRHMLDDESKRLKENHQKIIDRLFIPSGDVYATVQDFLKLGFKAFFSAHAYDIEAPPGLDAARVFNFGCDQFLLEWLGLNLRLKDLIGPVLLKTLRIELTEGAKLIIKFAENFLLTQCHFSMLQALEFKNQCTDRFSENLNQLLATSIMPDFSEPILIHDFKRTAVLAEVTTKNFWQILKDKISKEKMATAKAKPLTDRCLLRTYEVHFNTAKQYYELSLRSAQENYKFQYKFRTKKIIVVLN